MKNFENKVVVITGAGSGIGEAMAYEFARSHAELLLLGRREDKLNKVKLACESLHAKASVYKVDMSDEESIKAFAEDILLREINIDYLLLNAGISQRALTLETDYQVDKRVMAVNYFGPVSMVKYLRPMLLKTKSIHIAVTSSISGLFGFPMRSSYCASKHALFGFFESLELEYPQVKVTFLIPGRICTEISRSALLANGELYAKMDEGQAQGMPVEKCAKIALRAIAQEKHRQLIGGKELLMVYIKKYCPALFFKLARKISAT